MGFIEVKRYHVICDRRTCMNLFYTIDTSDESDTEEESSYPWELESTTYPEILIEIMYDNGWRFIGKKLLCPNCTSYADEESLFEFLKADMGIT